MSKRNYTHIQEFLAEIERMLRAGKSQREVAEHFGFKDKYVVKGLLKRERRKQRKEAA
ncbi:MAG TPA: imidazolonepropionase, partial [Candidatus Gallacutalibacter stercoravium]|nr:imidazolonepropionase [Candidatus Gallacutalibacter stercoravium]